MRKSVTKKNDSFKDLISQSEAARLRGVTRAAIRDLIRRKRLTPVEVASRLLLRRGEVQRFEKWTPGPKPKGGIDDGGKHE
jgi:predicted DNA-binding protein YlxM (UPF0122 family)